MQVLTARQNVSENSDYGRILSLTGQSRIKYGKFRAGALAEIHSSTGKLQARYAVIWRHSHDEILAADPSDELLELN